MLSLGSVTHTYVRNYGLEYVFVIYSSRAILRSVNASDTASEQSDQAKRSEAFPIELNSVDKASVVSE